MHFNFTTESNPSKHLYVFPQQDNNTGITSSVPSSSVGLLPSSVPSSSVGLLPLSVPSSSVGLLPSSVPSSSELLSASSTPSSRAETGMCICLYL